MLRNTISVAILITGLLLNGPAYAAQDIGLSPQSALGRDTDGGGVGAQLGLTIKFGGKAAVRDADRVQLGFAAGPVLRLKDRASPDRPKRAIANLIGFTVRPGYSASATMVGQSVLTYRTALGTAEMRRNASGDGDGPSTLGWIGIAAGATVVVLGVAALALEDALDCTENGEYVCE